MIIKICGITSVAVAQSVAQHGADLLGFVFAPSKRQIGVKQAAEIAREVRNIRKVGVFVDAPLGEVIEIAGSLKLDYVQLHGSEQPEYCRMVKCPVIKALSYIPELTPEIVNSYPVDYILFDTYIAGRQGGTGQTFNWAEAKTLFEEVSAPIILAGGLNDGNVGEAIGLLTPAGVDVSGGVETGGVKDICKIQQFITAVRLAE